MVIMKYPDFEPRCDLSFVSHEDVCQYLNDYAENFKLFQLIEFQSKIIGIKRDSDNNGWIVNVLHLPSGKQKSVEYDVVLVCVGRYSVPSWPPEFEASKFEKTLLHSHDYRKPENYANQRVAIIGAGISGVDIASELCDHAEEVLLVHRPTGVIYKGFPKNVKQLFGKLVEVHQESFVLKDSVGEHKEFHVDTIIVATGYKLGIDFINPSDCGLKVDVEEGVVEGVYRHLVNIRQPSMALMMLCNRIVPFPFYHQQVSDLKCFSARYYKSFPCLQILYYINFLTGRIPQPSSTQMRQEELDDIDYRCRTMRMARYKDRHSMTMPLMEMYLRKLEVDGHLNPLEDYVYGIHKDLYSIRMNNLMDYKKFKVSVHSDGHYEIGD